MAVAVTRIHRIVLAGGADGVRFVALGAFVDNKAVDRSAALPSDALLVSLPEPMPELAISLGALVRTAVPDSIERVRPGWRVIGYDVPIGTRRTAFFAWVMPQREHVHLGFPRGVLLRDPDRILEGAGVTKLARWVTARSVGDIDIERFSALVREAAALAPIPRAAGLVRIADPEWTAVEKEPLHGRSLDFHPQPRTGQRHRTRLSDPGQR